MISKPHESTDLKVFESVTLVGFQKQNWGEHSGMNSILNVVPVDRIFMKKPVPGIIYRAWKPFRKWFYSRNPYYEINSAWLETLVALDWFRQRHHIYHFLSGDNEFLFSGSLKRFSRQNLLVLSFHGLGDEIMHVAKNPNIRMVDAVVVVSSNMMDPYQSIFGADRVFYVPHGIDTHFWTPSESKRRNSSPQILFVGTHLRDFNVFQRVVHAISVKDSSIRFHAVVSTQNANLLKNLGHLTIYPRLSDEDLRRLYQTSDLLVCPLLECTASNSILEALACGLPIVATEIGGIRDYVSETTSILTPPGNADAMTEAILDLLWDEDRRFAMSTVARKRALELDWMVIAGKLGEVYKQLLV